MLYTEATGIGAVLMVKFVLTKEHDDIVGFVIPAGKLVSTDDLFFCRYVPGARGLQEGVTYQVWEESDGSKKTRVLRPMNSNLRVVA